MNNKNDKEVSILVVDDDPNMLKANAHLLKSAGHTVLQAATGMECLRIAREHQPDLILLDVNLPDIDGRDVCRQIKEDPALAGCFVVHLSAVHTSGDSAAEGIESGADSYISLPVSGRELLARVEALLRIKKAERELTKKNIALEQALSEIKTLRGIIPICSSCKKIRDDAGYWHQVEVYVRDHSEADFSHGMCEECARKLYPDIYKDR
jgi:DNA-binding response OmpR family regulator